MLLLILITTVDFLTIIFTCFFIFGFDTDVTVIVVLPSFLPCILPFESTVATPGFELLYLSSLFVAFAGEIIVSICVL